MPIPIPDDNKISLIPNETKAVYDYGSNGDGPAVPAGSGLGDGECSLTPKPSATRTAEGTVFYCSDDNHVYVGTE